MIINEETIQALIEKVNDLSDSLVTDLTSLKNYFNLVDERVDLLGENWSTSGSRELISSMKNISGRINNNTSLVNGIGDISNIKVHANKVSKTVMTNGGGF